MTTSYNGWPASKNPKAIGINPSWAPLGHRFPGGCKAGDVETVFTWLVERLDAEVEPIDRDAVKDEWGYVYKASANSPRLVSNHSSGTAFDYNATRHPNGKRGTWTPSQVLAIDRLLDRLDGVVKWLGHAKGTPDSMHFEIAGNAHEVATVAARIRSSHSPHQEDDVIGKDKTDDQKGVVRHLFRTVLLRNPTDQNELDLHLRELGRRGYEGYVEFLVESPEGKSVLNKERKAVGL